MAVDTTDRRMEQPMAAPAGQTKKPLRADIQGLRALAVGMVLLYHAGLPLVPGGFAGVDVFFVISGFLITGLMVRELERTGRLSLRNFWARRAKRLLPATAVVLLAVTALTLLFLPQIQWSDTAGDIAASALYVINWRLAQSSVDYLAQDQAASPVQHFWSLAVEEQFYVIWPLLVLVLVWFAGRFARLRPSRRPATEPFVSATPGPAAPPAGHNFGLPLRPTLIVGVGALSLASLFWSIRLGSNPEAYFVTTTRAWELGLGALVALLAPQAARLNPVVARLLTWAGALGLIVVALTLPDDLAWPSWYALAPTLATAAVIAGGPAAGGMGAVALIGLRPFRWLGDLSYSLYLWHWPLIVVATAYWEGLSVKRGLVVVLACVPLAFLTYRLVESPLHQSKTLTRLPARALWLGAVCTVIGVLSGLVVRAAIPSVEAPSAKDHPGAGVLFANPQQTDYPREVKSLTPDPLNARADLPDLYGRRCQGTYVDTVPKPCIFDAPSATAGSAAAATSPGAAGTGNGAGPAKPVTVALVGDSRAAQWSPAVQAVAAQQHWRVITITKAGCPFTQANVIRVIKERSAPYTSCTSWDAAAMKLLLSGPDRPDLVFTSSFYPYIAAVAGQPDRQAGARNDAELIAGLRGAWRTLNNAGIPVIALRETPLMGRDVASCVSKHRDDLNRCTTPREKALQNGDLLEPAAAGLRSSVTIDLTAAAICPPGPACPPVIGNVLVYRDNHHLTAQYSRSLAPFLTAELARLKTEKFAKGKLNGILPDAPRR